MGPVATTIGERSETSATLLHYFHDLDFQHVPRATDR